MRTAYYIQADLLFLVLWRLRQRCCDTSACPKDLLGFGVPRYSDARATSLIGKSGIAVQNKFFVRRIKLLIQAPYRPPNRTIIFHTSRRVNADTKQRDHTAPVQTKDSKLIRPSGSYRQHVNDPSKRTEEQQLGRTARLPVNMLSMSFPGVRDMPRSPPGSSFSEDKWSIQARHGSQRQWTSSISREEVRRVASCGVVTCINPCWCWFFRDKDVSGNRTTPMYRRGRSSSVSLQQNACGYHFGQWRRPTSARTPGLSKLDAPIGTTAPRKGERRARIPSYRSWY